MKFVTRDAKTNKNIVYDIKEMKTEYHSHHTSPKDSEDDELDELKERLADLEKKVADLEKDKDVKEDKDEEEEDFDEEDEEREDTDGDEEEISEGEEEIKDLGDCDTMHDSIQSKPFSSIGKLLKKPTTDSANSEEAEVDAWNKYYKKGN